MERVALKPRRAGMGSPKTLAVFGVRMGSLKTLAVFGVRMGSLKTLAVFGESEATHATIT